MTVVPVRAILVDDEPLARRRLRSMLSAHADVSIVAECEDADSCVQVIREVKPELVFLDIQMPGADGFDVVDRAQVTPRPFIIFVTAFAQHAVRAFDTDAVDYLLKPYDEKRLARALERARSAITAHGGGPPRYIERLAATIGRRTVFIRTDEIDWIEASGNYVNVHTSRHTYLLRTSMSAIEARLDPAKFARVHRSTIVRIDRVLELRSTRSGDYKLALSDGSIVPMSARYRDRLR
jgi:two-component system LytT family response regulator